MKAMNFYCYACLFNGSHRGDCDNPEERRREEGETEGAETGLVGWFGLDGVLGVEGSYHDHQHHYL